MKTIFILMLPVLLFSACEKKDHLCVCVGKSIMVGTYTKSYMIHDTKAKAKRQCKKTDREPFKLNLFAPDCNLR